LNEKDRNCEVRDDGFVLAHNLKGANINEWVEEYLDNESKRLTKRTARNNVITHEILSFSKSDFDKITPEILKDFAEKYIEFRGVQGIYLVAPHFKDNPHLHFCVSSLELESGLSMRLSKPEFARLKQNIQEYQQEKYRFLEKSIVQHGKGIEEMSDREVQLNIRKGKLSRKQILKNILSETLPNSPSLSELIITLESHGIKIYERGGKVYGVEYEGRNHRFDNLGFAEKIIELEKREILYHERLNELEEITQHKDGKEIKMKDYRGKELELDFVAENLVEYNVSEKEVGNAEEQPASDKLTPTD
jgi:hypothetical protein